MRRLSKTRSSRLDDQDSECAYCGKKIRKFQKTALAYDNHGIVHLKCANMGRRF